MKKVASNFFYQSLFQVCKIILPIITIPVVSRALGPEGIGLYNYSNSIVQYFILFGGLGIEIYANREIAIVRESLEDRSKVFFEIFSLKVIFSTVAIIVYIIFIYINGFDIIYIILIMLLLANLMDISWFFMGMEDFKKTSMVNLSAQIIGFICIVLFIHEPEDLLLYVFIQSASIFLSTCVTWFFLRGNIKFIKIKYLEMKRHFYPALIYFIPKISIVFYTNLNKTLLGIFDSLESVGLYSNSIALNAIFVTFLTTLDLVLMPKMTNLYAKKDTSKMKEIMYHSLHFQLYFSIAIMFGVWSIYDKFIPWFFGSEFKVIVNYVPLLTVLIVIIPIGMGISRQYLLPMNKINTYNKAVITGAVVSIFINIMLIPVIGIYGAIIASVVSEFFVCYIRTKTFIRDTNFKFNFKQILNNVVIGCIMLFLLRLFTYDMKPVAVTTILQAVTGLIIYILLTTITKGNPFFNYWKKNNERIDKK